MILSEPEIRAAFAAVRKLVAYSGPPGNQTCQHEEDMVDLAARQQRVPAELVAIDGWPSGGGSNGSRSSDRTSITERSGIELAEPDRELDDTTGRYIATALDMLTQAAMSANATRNNITSANQASTLRRPRAHMAEVCCEQGCDDLAVPGGRGRCNADRVWLSRHPGIASVPTEVIAARNNRGKLKRHDHDTPNDDVITRLVSAYDNPVV